LPDKGQRLDQVLVGRRLLPTRARARDAILRGEVLVNGTVETRPARKLRGHETIAVSDDAARYVSRGGLKLAHALDHFALDVTGKAALDIGASTGGFTDVLLQRGAASVLAVDVGHGQLDPAIAADAKVTSLEGVNARVLSADDVPAPVDLIVIDVSFISLKLVLEPALSRAAPGAHVVALIKPQFEVGRDALGKGGVVRDDEAAEQACRAIEKFITAKCGWRVMGLIESPVRGQTGNREFLIAAAHPENGSTLR